MSLRLPFSTTYHLATCVYTMCRQHREGGGGGGEGEGGKGEGEGKEAEMGEGGANMIGR